MFELIRANRRRSILLVAGFVAFLALVGAAIGALTGYGLWGTIIALVLSGAHRLRVVLEGRRHRPGGQPGAPRRPRAVPAVAQPRRRPVHRRAVCPSRASTSSTTRPRTPSPPAATPATPRSPSPPACSRSSTGSSSKACSPTSCRTSATTTSSVSTLAVTLVGAVALLTDTAIRLMWWNGGRVPRDGDRSDGSNPLAYLGFALLIFAPILAKAMQATISRRARDARRRERLPDDPVPAGTHRRVGEAP